MINTPLPTHKIPRRSIVLIGETPMPCTVLSPIYRRFVCYHVIPGRHSERYCDREEVHVHHECACGRKWIADDGEFCTCERCGARQEQRRARWMRLVRVQVDGEEQRPVDHRRVWEFRSDGAEREWMPWNMDRAMELIAADASLAGLRAA